MTWRGTTTMGDRIFASLPYLLPLMYGIPFGGSLLAMFPALGLILFPLIGPFAVVYSTIPFAGIVVFFALLLLVVRNERIAHFIRFNTMQALLISIVLFLCQLLIGVLANMGGSIALIVQVLNNTVFIAVLAVFVYAVVQSCRGRYAEIPAISEAVYMQVR
ncbi:MAG: Tic20 family protein [Thermosynechococcaceae cyanobacterium]